MKEAKAQLSVLEKEVKEMTENVKDDYKQRLAELSSKLDKERLEIKTIS
ncbi:hypothetical protein [Wolbachia endosymbiont of Brugia pahangi]|nr:hypothetical protein [Wolbachia endosymbiont of Brugia pahangi]